MNLSQGNAALMEKLVSQRDDYAYLMGWLRNLMRAFSKGRREGVEALEDGRARISVTYPSIGDLLYALQQFEALRAMAEEDSAADGH